MPNSRRKFIKTLLVVATYSVAVVGGILHSPASYGRRIKEYFSSGTFAETRLRLFGNASIISSEKIQISRLPRVAENGAMVPITINSSLDKVEKIFILVEQNPAPLSAEFLLSPLVAASVSARLKMAKSSNVVVIVQSGGQLYRSSRWVKVTVGGCGA